MHRRIAPLALVIASVATFPLPAHAHMGVETSDPANASTVDEAPDHATLTFNADVDIETAAAQLRRLGPADTPITEALRRDVPTDPLPVVDTDGRTAVFDLPELDDGLYAIDWSVNEAGGHANSSFILFKVTDDVEDGFGDTGGSNTGAYVLYGAIAAAVGVASALTVIGVKRRRS